VKAASRAEGGKSLCRERVAVTAAHEGPTRALDACLQCCACQGHMGCVRRLFSVAKATLESFRQSSTHGQPCRRILGTTPNQQRVYTTRMHRSRGDFEISINIDRCGVILRACWDQFLRRVMLPPFTDDCDTRVSFARTRNASAHSSAELKPPMRSHKSGVNALEHAHVNMHAQRAMPVPMRTPEERPRSTESQRARRSGSVFEGRMCRSLKLGALSASIGGPVARGPGWR